MLLEIVGTRKKAYIFDAPNYPNVGDSLILLGSIQLLKEIGIEIEGIASSYSKVKKNISQSTVIVISGGGNFGNLYEHHSREKQRIAQLYPNNLIIQFPCSVATKLDPSHDVFLEEFVRYPNVKIFARDAESERILEKLGYEVVLFPDAIHWIDFSQYHLAEPHFFGINVSRTDSESPIDTERVYSRDFDWMSESYAFFAFRTLLLKTHHSISKYILLRYAAHRVNRGLQIISLGKQVHTNRLHCILLSLLMDKEVTFFPNQVKKIDNYLSTWDLLNAKISILHSDRNKL